MKKPQSKAQTLLEYMTVIIIVTGVLMAMNTMFKRTIQGTIKTVADQIGKQQCAEQDFNEGFLNYLDSKTQSISTKRTQEFLGNKTYLYVDSSQMNTTSFSDLGSK